MEPGCGSSNRGKACPVRKKRPGELEAINAYHIYEQKGTCDLCEAKNQMDIENVYYQEVLQVFDQNKVNYILIGGLRSDSMVINDIQVIWTYGWNPLKIT